MDGFNLEEIAEAAIYPHFSQDGGVDSERTFLKQYLQKFLVPDDVKENLFDKDAKKNKKGDPVPF